MVDKRRWDDIRTRDIHHAYQCVRIYVLSVKADGYRMPSLTSLLDRPKRRQTADDLEAQLRLLSARTGYPVIEVPVHVEECR